MTLLRRALLVFLLLALAPGLRAAAPAPASPSAGVAGSLRNGFDEDLPIAIQGKKLVYNEKDETLLAEGDVVLESGGARVHAERLWYDLKKGTLRAEGDVVVAEGGNTLWATRVAMDQVSKTGRAEGLLYYQAPWTAACGGAEVLPNDVLLLHGCECTSCLQEQPYWRLSAKMLKIKAGDRLWAWGVWLHAGRVPVFYLPYYSQSLKDPRPPIEIKPGYSKALGAYVRTGYNYYLGDGQYGTLRYDWMDKTGNGYGLSEHYRLGLGEGDVSGYLAVDKNDASKKDWSANLSHRQPLGNGLSLLANLDLLSNAAMNETFDVSQVDVFQRRSYLALQDSQADYAWTAQFSETQVLQTVPDGVGGVASRELVVAERLLPGINFTRFSRPVKEGSPLYWGVDAQASRSLQTPRLLITATASTLYDTQNAYYQNSVSITPSLSHTLRLLPRLALNSNLNLSQGWQRRDGSEDGGGGITTYGTFFNLQARPFEGFSIDGGHRYRRQLTPMEGLQWAGEQVNRLEARVQAQFGEPLSLLGTTEYDLLPWRTDNDLKRLSLLRLQGTWSPNQDRSVNVSAGWHAPTGLLKTVDAWLNANDHHQRWQLNLGLNWVNNRIIPGLPALDPSAPFELKIEDPRVTPDQLLASLRSSLALGPKWKLSFYQRLDLTNRRTDEQAFSIYRDFNCIDFEVYARETLSTGWQYGFALSLRSVPNLRVNSNQVTADLFDQVQYGY